MYVCLCKGVTDRAIHEAVAGGARNLRDVSRELGIARQCGKCACLAKSIVAEAQGEQTPAGDACPAPNLPLWYCPAV